MLKIGGLQKMSLIDYPGKIAASVFLAGCNFRCAYCHNPDLVEIKPHGSYLNQNDFFAFLKKRQGVLDAVCVSGGEPLLYSDLPDFLQQIKALGYLIKLDTNGSQPDFLRQVIDQNLIDYIAMDVKASLSLYPQVVGLNVDVNKITKTIALIMKSGLDYEFRTTVLPKWHSLAEIEKIVKMITGAKIYYIQNFKNKLTLDPAYSEERSFSDQELAEMKNIALKYVQDCQIRS